MGSDASENTLYPFVSTFGTDACSCGGLMLGWSLVDSRDGERRSSWTCGDCGLSVQVHLAAQPESQLRREPDQKE